MATNRFIRNIKLQADSSGNAPVTLQLLTVGTWNTPWHGDFEISPADIDQFVTNYQANTGLPADSDGKIQVNYGHRSYDKAAGWMSNLRAEEVNERISLVADVEWTEEALTAIKAGEWRYISPEFNPRALPWEDPEEEWRLVANVITGAGLTNIPLFKKLKKVAASERPEPTDGSNNNNEGESMSLKLEDVRILEASALTDEHKTFLEEHKAELSTEELKKFDIKADETPADPAPTKVEANAQTVSISASELADLKSAAAQGVAAAQTLAQKEASDFASARIQAGQVKSDQKDSLVKILLASSADTRTELETFLSGLPENEDIKAGEQGHSSTVDASASTEMFEKAEKIVADSQGKETLTSALKTVLASDKDLAARVDQERKA